MKQAVRVLVNLQETNMFHYWYNPKVEFSKYAPYMHKPPPYYRPDHWKLAATIRGPLGTLYKPVRIHSKAEKYAIFDENVSLSAMQRYLKELNNACSEDTIIQWHLPHLKQQLEEWHPYIQFD